MPNDLVLYNSKDGKSLMTVIYNGRECWIATQVAEMSNLSDVSKSVYNFIKTAELESGVDYEVLTGTSLTYFKSLLDSVGCQLMEQCSISLNTPNLTIFYESGLWAFLSSLRTEEGKALRKWINRDVLPSIRKTGSYSVSTETFQPVEPYSKLIEAYDVFMSRVDRVNKMTGKNYEINTQRAHNAACKLLGIDHQLQIELPDKYMNATQIAKKLGVYTVTDKSGPAYGFIGKVCSEIDLNEDEVIKCEDKTAFGKTISVTNYFPSVIPKIEEWINNNKPENKTKRNGKESYAFKFTKHPLSYVEFK